MSEYTINDKQLIVIKYLTTSTWVSYYIDSIIGFDETDIKTLKLTIAEIILDHFNTMTYNYTSKLHLVYTKLKTADRITRNISDYICRDVSLKYSVREESLNILNNLKIKFYNNRIEDTLKSLESPTKDW